MSCRPKKSTDEPSSRRVSNPRRLSDRECMMDDVTETLPRAVLVDIDGTLALRGAHAGVRSFFDWSRVGEDQPNPPVVELVRLIADTDRYTVILMSGRDEVCRPETEAWLKEHAIPYDQLHMRPERDNRKDSIVKRELYEAHVAGRHSVAFVIDDRNQVVREWRSMGLTVFQCADGDF